MCIFVTMERTEEKEILDSITERIFQFVEAESLSYADFAATLDIGPAVVSHMKNGRNKVSLNVYAKILESFPKLNPDWLLLGQGNMYRQENVVKKESAPSLFSAAYQSRSVENTKGGNVQRIIEEVKAAKAVKRIVIFYDDNSFQEFMP